MGDFNYPQIDWCTSTVPGGNNSPAVMFLDSCEDVYLVQHVQKVTRSRGSQQPSLLDLVFTSIPETIDSITHLAPLGSSDHDLLVWNYTCLYQPVPQTSTTNQWNYSRGSFVEFNKYFQQLDWSQMFNNDVEHNWSLLKQHILTAQELLIPQVTKKPRTNKVPWWSKQVKTAVNRKQKAFQTKKCAQKPVTVQILP